MTVATGAALTSLHQTVAKEWGDSGRADLVTSLRRHPKLLRDRSLLLTLAVEEFRVRRQDGDVSDLELYCSRFRDFGGSIEQTILKQLETQRYFDDNVDLSEIAPPTGWPAPGDSFGSFRVIEELGFGSLAKVFLSAEKEVGDRLVAVKVSPLAGIEAAVLGRLDHPNIIPILSTGYVKTSDLHYVCMPFCGRSTLSDLIDLAFAEGVPRDDGCVLRAATRWSDDERELSRPSVFRRIFGLFSCETYVDRVLRIAAQIADGLDHGHRRRILHGDLKPSNVLLTPAGTPLLLDFNLSQDFARSLFHRGGTLPYMPPEHLRLIGDITWKQRPEDFNPSSDIYSFGALLYELLAGVPPVCLPKEGTDAATVATSLLEQIKNGPEPISQRNPLVSGRIQSVIDQCLSFELRDRPASTGEVKRQLLRQARWPAAFSRRARMRPIAASLAATTLAGTIIGSGLYYESLPPRSVAAYEKGLAFISQGNIASAATCLTRAVEIDPSFDAARYQRGVVGVRLDRTDLAMRDFYELAQKGDARSMACLAYCFNLKNGTGASGPWYERAIQHGASSTAVYNNLGATYLAVQTQANRTDRIKKAEDYLLKALSRGENLRVVRLNLVRCAIEKSQADANYDPVGAWPQAYSILTESPNDEFVRFHVAGWYQAVQQWKPSIHGSTGRAPLDSVIEPTAVQAFRGVATENWITFSPSSDKRLKALEDPAAARKHYYLEPF